MKKDPRVYLVQILERAERILNFTQGGHAAFSRSTLIQDAVIRNLEIIGGGGEACAGRIPSGSPVDSVEGAGGSEGRAHTPI